MEGTLHHQSRELSAIWGNFSEEEEEEDMGLEGWLCWVELRCRANEGSCPAVLLAEHEIQKVEDTGVTKEGFKKRMV